MIEMLAETSTERLNMFPAKHGISKYYSPNTIMSKELLEYNKHCKYSFGEYVQAHHQNQPMSTMKECAINGIYLRPNTNKQGGHIVMNLSTGKEITRGKVTPIPLTPIVQE